MFIEHILDQHVFKDDNETVMCLAYQTMQRTFRQLDYMIQVFCDAEGGRKRLFRKKRIKMTRIDTAVKKTEKNE